MPVRLRWFFAFFFVSGFCSLVDEVVWLRLAMAAFGVTTPLVSIFLSVFMAGLALGSWLGGKLAARLSGGGVGGALRVYAVVEMVIGLSALVVPVEMGLGRAWLRASAADGAQGSSLNYLASGAVLTIILLPFCTAMGATFPLAIEAIRRGAPGAAERSFSYLYLANVIGAAAGTLASALVFIELWGFRGTLIVTGVLNGVLAAGAFWLAARWRLAERPGTAPLEKDADAPGAAARGAERARPPARSAARARSRAHGEATPPAGVSKAAGSAAAASMLFITGLASMGMEVVWVRQFTPFLGTVVYAFAAILAIYLTATFAGSILYRRSVGSVPRDAAAGGLDRRLLWSGAAVAALLPLAMADPRLGTDLPLPFMLARVALGIGPVCLAIGFLTPMLVDTWSRGGPERAGTLYALNVLGCIAGPLVACFLLLPFVGERGALIVLAMPLLACAFSTAAVSGPGEGRASRGKQSAGRRRRGWAPAALGLLALALLLFTRDFETIFRPREVRRDSMATVIATGEGGGRHIIVNGSGMTMLHPVTKMMAHLPLALHTPDRPRNALVICFGMGTSFRSALTWDIPVTAVELVPSVPALFGYFHADAAATLASPGARVVIDDGRRYLERTSELYDMITIDPPPPVEAAGSSLLYTREFLEIVRSRLAPGGIVQLWLPQAEDFVAAAIARALQQSFPHVRVLLSHQYTGVHFIASTRPIPAASPAELAARMPARAAADLVEWSPGWSAEKEFSHLLAKERSVEFALSFAPGAPMMEDDRPVNEYFLLRRYSGFR